MTNTEKNVLKPSRPAGFFITGTDTDVGKTFATGCIGLSLIKQGFEVAPRKPIASGCIPQADDSLLSEDALFIQQACLSNEPLKTICPHTFEPAISPQRALFKAKQNITTHDLTLACHTPNSHFALIEGAGGFYSPLAIDGLNVDLAQALNHPVILVVGNKLGCINHARLTIEAIKAANLPLHSVIVNDTDPTADKDNLIDIQALLKADAIPCYHLAYSENFTAQAIPGFQI